MNSTEQAQVVAEELLERVQRDIRRAGPEHDFFWLSGDGAGWLPTWLPSGTLTRDGRDYDIAFTTESIVDQTTVAPLGSGLDGTELTDNNVRLVEVNISWAPQASSPGRGREEYSLSRLLSERGT